MKILKRLAILYVVNAIFIFTSCDTTNKTTLDDRSAKNAESNNELEKVKEETKDWKPACQIVDLRYNKSFGKGLFKDPRLMRTFGEFIYVVDSRVGVLKFDEDGNFLGLEFEMDDDILRIADIGLDEDGILIISTKDYIIYVKDGKILEKLVNSYNIFNFVIFRGKIYAKAFPGMIDPGKCLLNVFKKDLSYQESVLEYAEIPSLPERYYRTTYLACDEKLLGLSSFILAGCYAIDETGKEFSFVIQDENFIKVEKYNVRNILKGAKNLGNITKGIAVSNGAIYVMIPWYCEGDKYCIYICMLDKVGRMRRAYRINNDNEYLVSSFLICESSEGFKAALCTNKSDSEGILVRSLQKRAFPDVF